MCVGTYCYVLVFYFLTCEGAINFLRDCLYVRQNIKPYFVNNFHVARMRGRSLILIDWCPVILLLRAQSFQG